MELTLRAARVNAGLTQEQVHERLGIAMSTLSRIERGKSSPRYKTLCELCELYGISVGQLKRIEREAGTSRSVGDFRQAEVKKFVQGDTNPGGGVGVRNAEIFLLQSDTK